MKTSRTRTGLIKCSLVLLSLQAYANDGEKIPPNEADSIRAIVQMIEKVVRSNQQSEGRAFRDAHRKSHGCVNGIFEVLPHLKAPLNNGLFANPHAYKAFIRFSNGSGKSEDDRSGDGRGMAIKLLGVEGPKLLADEMDANTQDFVMINHPVFFVRNARDYVGFQKALTKGGLSLAGWLFNPLRLFHEGRIANTIRSKKMQNPLQTQYFSMTPSKLGPTQMKFSAKACASNFIKNPFHDSPNLLSENMKAQLQHSEACFDFAVQLRVNNAKMPIEDPTIEWSEKLSPYQTVAKLVIARQIPDNSESCETASFTPWHSLAAHRPLGGISRVRKEVYQSISRLRHELNGQPRVEP